MPYAVNELTGEIIEITYYGSVTYADLLSATSNSVRLQRERGILKVLIVADDAEAAVEAARIDELAREYRALERRRSTKIAIIRPMSASARSFAEIYEEKCRELGWNARVLADRKAALAWLKA
jgi:hypothetical protein